jgi:flagellar basal-body rod protein FlgB
MDACELRHRVLSGNLANVNTPNYVRKEVKFKDALKNAMDAGELGPGGGFKPEVVADKSRTADIHGNNINMQDELSAITDNSLLYGMAAKVLSNKYAGLKKAISGK